MLYFFCMAFPSPEEAAAESRSAEAINAAAVAAEATEKARAAQLASAMRYNDDRIIALIKTALHDPNDDVPKGSAIQLALIQASIKQLQSDLTDLKNTLKEQSLLYVTKTEFTPIRNGFYLMVSTLGLATLAAVFKLIFIK